MALLKAQVNLPRITGIPADVSVNTWWFETTGDFVNTASITPVHNALVAFYGAIDAFLSPVLATAANIKYYDMWLPKPNPPVETRALTLTVGTGTALPEECACCLSFAGDPLAGANPRRRRGRVYIGPLTVTAVVVTAGRALVSGTVMGAIKDAGQALLTASVAAAEWSWIVYSPTATMDA